ncbi:ImmA/IrrE family metallo-endopeptidase [Halodesulfovibrio sp.]|uniref:ImmA/IrrE family metallo-endopeptidase n=1 Tax=Halodesulfovibrio sp. TaxID=1912772 RepID=UPI0025C10F11|nr:ImmA/IrrE family metallo-endopeptidase [Halodesulfovibrio sp.]
MKSKHISDRSARDINQQVEKILRGLGNPEPPLDVATVLELLQLDKSYYTTDDDSVLREITSRLMVAGKQIVKRPGLIIDVIKKFDLKALCIPDQKRIFIDRDLPKLKHRWSEAHEIAHQFIPWHEDTMLGDDAHTLSKECHAIVESEANYGAGQLLFMGNRFTQEASDYTPTFKHVLALKEIYGNTITSTFWRFIESSHNELPMFGIISDHPRYPQNASKLAKPYEYFIQSKKFHAEFSQVDPVSIYTQVVDCCGYGKWNIVGEGTIKVSNDNGQPFEFKVETFYNRYQALTLGVEIGSTSRFF